jgi:hypothetical protein
MVVLPYLWHIQGGAEAHWLATHKDRRSLASLAIQGPKLLLTPVKHATTTYVRRFCLIWSPGVRWCKPPRGITTYEVHLARPWRAMPLLFGENVHVAYPLPKHRSRTAAQVCGCPAAPGTDCSRQRIAKKSKNICISRRQMSLSGLISLLGEGQWPGTAQRTTAQP